MKQIRLLVIFLLFITVFGCTYQNGRYQKNTTYNEKLSSELINVIKETNREILHLQIKFNKVLSNDEKINLTHLGVLLDNYKGNNTWRASVPLNKIKVLSDDKNIVLIRTVSSDEKIVTRFRNRTFYPHEIKEGDIVFVMVAFYLDVNNSNSKNILNKYGANIEYQGDILGYGHGPYNDYKISINKNLLNILASEDEVNYIHAIRGPEIVHEKKNNI